jgi:hypothetical protein
MNDRTILLALTSACFIGCGGAEAEPADQPTQTALPAEASTCEIVTAGMALPIEVRETSGLARSARDPELFWTHNDAGNEPVLFAIAGTGSQAERVRVTGAQSIDWEDLELAPCDDGNCLYVGDIGDNAGRRGSITIYRLAEPMSGATASAPAEVLHARFPDGPQDAEGLFVDRAGDIFVVTKGRSEAIALYRFPVPQRVGETAVLERVRELFPEPQDERDRVSAATATPDGRFVGVRTYRTLYLYPTDRLLANEPVEPVVFDLTPLGESQGEGLVLANDGSVWLTSEAENRADQPRWSRLRCEFSRGE